ncbi:MAG TPA: hypothetical protein PK283_02105 [Thiotrichales bacterium]|nr:hypothetical protein [Thiotrichales bacterium]HQR95322.1 hypothetical protein [Thiotrichales bacterium]
MALLKFTNQTKVAVNWNDGITRGTFHAIFESRKDESGDNKLMLCDLKDVDLGDLKETFISAFNGDTKASEVVDQEMGAKGVEVIIAIQNARADFLSRNGRANR